VTGHGTAVSYSRFRVRVVTSPKEPVFTRGPVTEAIEPSWCVLPGPFDAVSVSALIDEGADPIDVVPVDEARTREDR
jgi:hypothetical protein